MTELRLRPVACAWLRAAEYGRLLLFGGNDFEIMQTQLLQSLKND